MASQRKGVAVEKVNSEDKLSKTFSMQDPIFYAVRAELERAYEKFPERMPSSHHGIAVIREELDELWDEVKADRGRTQAARVEALQVAAMALRYILDLANPWEHHSQEHEFDKHCLCSKCAGR